MHFFIKRHCTWNFDLRESQQCMVKLVINHAAKADYFLSMHRNNHVLLIASLLEHTRPLY